MAYTTVVAGTTITAAWSNANNRDQVVTPFASSAARASAITAPIEGMVSHLNDVNTLGVYSGSAWSTVGPVHGAWTSYTPTWTGTIGNGTLEGFYRRVGRDIAWRVKVTWGSTTSHAASDQTFGFPVAAAGAYINCPMGQAGVNISSNNYVGEVWWVSSTTFKVRNGLTTFWTNTAPATFVTANVLIAQGFYEAAADA